MGDGGGDVGDGGDDGDVEDESQGAVVRQQRQLSPANAKAHRPRRHYRRDASQLKEPSQKVKQKEAAKGGAASGAGGGGSGGDSGSGGGGLSGGDGGEGGGGGDSDDDGSDECECQSHRYSCNVCKPDVRCEAFYVALEETGGQQRAGTSTLGMTAVAGANKIRRRDAVGERREYIIKRAQAMRALVERGGFWVWKGIGKGRDDRSSSRHALNFLSKAIPGNYDTTVKAFDAWWLVHASGWVEELI